MINIKSLSSLQYFGNQSAKYPLKKNLSVLKKRISCVKWRRVMATNIISLREENKKSIFKDQDLSNDTQSNKIEQNQLIKEIKFTKFSAPGVAKSYSIVNGGIDKSPAKNFQTGQFETASVASIDELHVLLRNLKPGDFVTSGIHKEISKGKCGLGKGDIRRTKEEFPFAIGQPGLLIIDSDNIDKMGVNNIDNYAVILEKLIGNADYVLSPSASSGITYNNIVGKIKGIHAFLLLKDVANVPIFLEILHKRSVILSYAWPLITENGQVLIRSLVDTAMKTSNQCCYEGGAILNDGITQKREVVCSVSSEEISFLDVVPLSEDEEIAFRDQVEKLTTSVKNEAENIRKDWRSSRHTQMVAKGCDPKNADQILDSALSDNHPILSSEFEIQTDKYGTLTIREILANKEKYHEATCRDPLDPNYGSGKAKIYSNNQGVPAIHSFAHGEKTYILEEELFSITSKNIEGSNDNLKIHFQKHYTVDEMCEQFVYIESGGEVSPRKNPILSLSFSDFKMATASSKTKVGNDLISTAYLWLSEKSRLSVYTKTFRPGDGEFADDPEGKKALNLWKPVPLSKTLEDYEDYAQPFFDHLAYLIPDEGLMNIFIDYLAHIEQKPGEKVGFGWLMVTDEVQGIGRNWMSGVLARIWPRYTALDFNLLAAIKDNFTGRLSRKLLIVVNEIVATQIKDRYEFVERSKNLITDETIEINPKYGRRHVEFLLARWIIFSNHIAAMPLADHDRRFVVVQNPSTPKSQDYYENLYSLMYDPIFIASVRRILIERVITSNLQGRAPATQAKDRVIEATRSPMDSALMEIKGFWPSELIRSSVCIKIVMHLMGINKDDLSEIQIGSLTYAYRRCGFVRLDKKIRNGKKVERIYALRNSEKWNSLCSNGDFSTMINTQISNDYRNLPLSDKERAALSDASDWGEIFERIQTE